MIPCPPGLSSRRAGCIMRRSWRVKFSTLTTMNDDYYKILEVASNASKDDIQKAYRKLARKYHPDLNQNDPKKAREKFQKVQEAFDILGDVEKRKFYDQYGVSPDKVGSGGGQGESQWSFGGGGPFRGAGGSTVGGQNFNFENLEDVLNMFGGAFSGGRGHSGSPTMEEFFRNGGGAGSSAARPVKGNYLERSITIPFTTAVVGGKVELRFRRAGGKDETVTVSIPPGIEAGKKIRLSGLGNPGRNGGKPGNLLVVVQVEEHPFFTRRGNQLYVQVPVTLHEAVFGGKIDIPTPRGNVTLTVPAGSSTGTKLRVKGQGIIAKDSVTKKETAGDLFAELSVTLPKKWSADDLKLLEKIRTDTEKPVRSELRW